MTQSQVFVSDPLILTLCGKSVVFTLTLCLIFKSCESGLLHSVLLVSKYEY